MRYVEVPVNFINAFYHLGGSHFLKMIFCCHTRCHYARILYLKITMQSLTQSWCKADVYFIFVSLVRWGERL